AFALDVFLRQRQRKREAFADQPADGQPDERRQEDRQGDHAGDVDELSAEANVRRHVRHQADVRQRSVAMEHQPAELLPDADWIAVRFLSQGQLAKILSMRAATSVSQVRSPPGISAVPQPPVKPTVLSSFITRGQSTLPSSSLAPKPLPGSSPSATSL